MNQTHKIKGPYEAVFKRLIDVVASSLVIILFFWLYLILALIVRIQLGSPVIFTQDRPGKNGKVFKLYKFRSMSDKRDENGELLPDKMRLNKFGRILRSTSLDELPELFNIIKGDMSVVGPRPILYSQMEECNAYEKQRLIVKPGLTCYWQVCGRARIKWDRWVELDLQYIQDMSILKDLELIFRTFPAIFGKDGAY